MWSKCSKWSRRSKRPPSRPLSPAPAASRAALALVGLAAAALLPGMPAAGATETLSLRALAASAAGPDTLTAMPTVVPGEQNQLVFELTCKSDPPDGGCRGGTVVALFGASQGHKLLRAWTSHGATCVTADWYLACPIDPSAHDERQDVTYLLDVQPWDYSDVTGMVSGQDGLALPRSTFAFHMQGKGSLDLSPPQNVVIPETSGFTLIPYSNRGPSMNRGLSLRFGPFPLYLNAQVLTPGVDCLFTPDRFLECDAPDLLAHDMRSVFLRLNAVPPFPPVPNFTVIHVIGNSDLQQGAQVDFLATIVPPPPPGSTARPW